MPNQLASPSPTAIATGTSSGPILPAIIADAGDKAAKRFIEFFTATIRNGNTRRAYAKAVADFFGWCQQHGLTLPGIEPVHVAAYIEQLTQLQSRPHRQAAPRRHRHAVRLADQRRHPALQPGRLGSRPEARRQTRQDARADRRGSPPAARQHRCPTIRTHRRS